MSMTDENETFAVAWLAEVASGRRRLLNDPVHEAALVAIGMWFRSQPELSDRAAAAYQSQHDEPTNRERWSELTKEAAVGAGLLCPVRLPEDPALWAWLVPIAVGIAEAETALKGR